MTVIKPDMVLGKPVVNARGENVGEVVDVGVHTVDRVKFLLIGGQAPSGAPPVPAVPPARSNDRFVRIGVDLIHSVGREAVVLKQT